VLCTVASRSCSGRKLSHLLACVIRCQQTDASDYPYQLHSFRGRIVERRAATNNRMYRLSTTDDAIDRALRIIPYRALREMYIIELRTVSWPDSNIRDDLYVLPEANRP